LLAAGKQDPPVDIRGPAHSLPPPVGVS